MEEAGTGRTLVIVESPAKAKTIGKYLGTRYMVRASMGHVRDLPAKTLGVDVEAGTFAPQYEISSGRAKIISEIRGLAKSAGQVILATDPDREGEAIAWHISMAALGRNAGNAQRVEFHEITQSAIRAALAKPRPIDMNLVNAQQARRVLDRLVGYKISPFLSRKIQQRSLSAGRVQSVALRVVVDREREIEQFVPREFWTVEADLAKHPFSRKKNDIFHAVLFGRDGKKLEFEKGEEANKVVADLEGARWSVGKVSKKEGKRYPSAPFTTSTLQQEASRKLRFPSKKTMQVAQQLYEGVSLGAEGSTGLITYMRTDSTQVAFEAQQAAREVIQNLFGPDYLPPKPPFYAKKAKGAQEAHEAIRPTKPAREPDAIKGYLTTEQYLLYRLIWRRFTASQMAPAIIEHTVVEVEALPPGSKKEPYNFRATGERVVFPGFIAVYQESTGDREGEDTNPEDEKGLPRLEAGDLLDLLKLLAEQHFTQPPPRYGEASLVKSLEELGVGRPSTYASILSTIEDRGYVVKVQENKERKFRPTSLGKTVNDLLVSRFPDILDVQFTARMEEDLDEVAEGKKQWVPLVAAFYGPMMEKLALADREVAKIAVPEETLEAMVVKESGSGRGNYGARSRSYPRKAGGSKTGTRTYGTKSRAKTAAGFSSEEPGPSNPTTSTPTRKRTNTRKTTGTPENSNEILSSTPSPGITLASPGNECPLCGKPMARRKGPYSEFFGCTGFPKCRGTRKV